MGKIFYIMGKSSSGKDSFYRALMKKNPWGLKKLVIYTTVLSGMEKRMGGNIILSARTGISSLRQRARLLKSGVMTPYMAPGGILPADDGTVDPARENYLASELWNPTGC